MLFLLPVGTDRVLYRRPVVTYGLLLANTAVLLAPLVSGAKTADVIAALGAARTNVLAEPWRLVTHQFVHGGFLHFAFNMLYLYLVGAAVEDQIGRPRTLLLYLLGGIAAGGLHLALIPEAGRDLPLVGASGAVSAFMGAFCILMPWSEFNVAYAYFLYFRWWGSGFFKCPALMLLGFYFIFFDVLPGVFAVMSRAVGSVAHWAHIGGFILGAGTAAALYGFQALFHTESEMAGWKRGNRLEADRRAGKTPAKVPAPAASEFSALLHFILIEDGLKAGEEYRRLLAANPNLVLPPEMQTKLDRLLLNVPAEQTVPPPPASRFSGLPSPKRPAAPVQPTGSIKPAGPVKPAGLVKVAGSGQPAAPVKAASLVKPAGPVKPAGLVKPAAPPSPPKPKRFSETQYTLRPLGDEWTEPELSPPPARDGEKRPRHDMKDTL